jgi:hypothetical protein
MPDAGQAAAGVTPDEELTKHTVVWVYRPACVFGQQILGLLVLTGVLFLVSAGGHATPRQTLHEFFSLQGLAYGVPLGMLCGLLHVHQWMKSARDYCRAAQRNPWGWLLNFERHQPTPEERRTGTMAVCLFVILLITTTSGVSSLGFERYAGSAWYSGLVGWWAAWDVGYLIWWRRLPSG